MGGKGEGGDAPLYATLATSGSMTQRRWAQICTSSGLRGTRSSAGVRTAGGGDGGGRESRKNVLSGQMPADDAARPPARGARLGKKKRGTRGFKTSRVDEKHGSRILRASRASPQSGTRPPPSLSPKLPSLRPLHLFDSSSEQHGVRASLPGPLLSLAHKLSTAIGGAERRVQPSSVAEFQHGSGMFRRGNCLGCS